MRRIGRIEVDNFKSLVDFQMDLPKFSCLIGLNGSGKSTVLQFIDFLSQLFRGDMKGWLEQRRWKPADLKSKLTKKTSITIGVELRDEDGTVAGRWDATYSPSKDHCTKECLVSPDAVLRTERRHNIEKLLQHAFPYFNGLGTKSFRFGWKQLAISESYVGEDAGFFPALTTEARHVSDGTLRIIAMLAALQSDDQFLLFDEIENGISPDLLEFIVNQFVEARQQVLATTNGPMILNSLEDEVARAGVIYLYKTPLGTTKAIPFFTIPSQQKKLAIMGPGEVFADTKLSVLTKELATMSSNVART
jgi:ABC-type histidine transport system ATPase subunit